MATPTRLAIALALLLGVAGCSRRDPPGLATSPEAHAEKAPKAAPPIAIPIPKAIPKAAAPPLELKPVASCTLPGEPAAGTIGGEGEVVYGAAGQALDIAWPKGKGPFPLIVLFHGGGWFSGEKSNLGRETEALAGAGYVVATIGYRLATKPAHRFPACIEDARCAVRWLRGQAKRYSIDPERVAVAGVSAGGQIAAMLALAEKAPGLDGGACSAASQPVAVSGAALFYAPSDLRSSSLLGSGEAETLPKLFGKEPEQVPAAAALASPITHVHAGGPPMLLIHGIDDKTTPISHSRKLKATLEKAKVPSLLVEVPGAGHDFPLLSGKPEYLRHSCTLLAFFESILKRK